MENRVHIEPARLGAEERQTSAEGSGAFTPGPWVAKMQFGEWFVRQDPSPWDGMGYQLVCTLPAARKGTHYGEMFRANARLIAAAPELYRMLAFCVSHPDDCLGDNPHVLALCRAALSKAEGRS